MRFKVFVFVSRGGFWTHEPNAQAVFAAAKVRIIGVKKLGVGFVLQNRAAPI
jgi:hypothetical protein